MKFFRMLMVLLGASIIPFFGVGLLKPEIRYRTEVYIDVPRAETFAAMADLAYQERWRGGLNELRVLAPGAPLIGQQVEITGWHGNREGAITLGLEVAKPDSQLVIVTETPTLREVATVTFIIDGAEDRGTTIVWEGRVRGRTYLHRCFNAFVKDRYRREALVLLYGFKYAAEEDLERMPFVEDEEIDSGDADSLMEEILFDAEELETILLEGDTTGGRLFLDEEQIE